MTDNDIIKAYEGLTSNQQLNLFRNFYYNNGFSTEKGIIANAINDILPKYCKQQKEVEQWKEEANKYQNLWCTSVDDIEKVKAKAVKDFTERLKENISDDCHIVSNEGEYVGVGYDCTDVIHCIDNLVKEIVGGGKK